MERETELEKGRDLLWLALVEALAQSGTLPRSKIVAAIDVVMAKYGPEHCAGYLEQYADATKKMLIAEG